MKIQSLKLRGWIGIKKGMGLDEIELDLSDLSGLIALAGPNGHGKTTVLDNLTPFRRLASRKRALSHHVFLRDSLKDLTFRYQGHTYRTLVKIDAQSERSEGFVWRDDEPLIDGKASSYDEFISGLLGSPNLFFNSVFAAQNGKKLSDMTAGDLKKLFSEFLRLDRLIEFEKTAKQCVGILSGKYTAIDRKVDQLEKEIAANTITREDLIKAQDAIHQFDARKLRLKRELEKADQAVKDATERMHKNVLVAQKVEALESDRARIENDLSGTKAEYDRRLKGLREKYSTISKEIDALSEIMGDRARIEGAVSEVQSLSERIDAANTEVAKCRTAQKPVQEKINKIQTDIQANQEELSRLEGDSELAVLKHQAETAHAQTQDLVKRDPACQSKTCSFIMTALKAKDTLTVLSAEIKARAAAISARKKEIAASVKEMTDNKDGLLNALKTLTEKETDLERTIKAASVNLSKIKPIANKAGDLAVAQARTDELEKQKTEIEDDGREVAEKRQLAITAIRTNLAHNNAEIEKERALIDKDAESAVKASTERFNQVKSDLAALPKEEAGFLESLKSVEKALAQKDADQKALDTAKAERSLYLKEQSQWIYLKDACSKNGLQALEIDSVAPVITGYANSLLTQTFGPSHSVKFVTQDPETGREIMDIKVIREDGSEVLLDNLSGGEKVWSLKALRLAMTLISKEKSGRDFNSIFCDEADGSLDVSNAQSFVAMYQALMNLGGIDTCFFISHKPECVLMADHQITFNGSGVSIE